jgi:hypothetical protein
MPTELNPAGIFLATSRSILLLTFAEPPSRKRYGVPGAWVWQAGQALLTRTACHLRPGTVDAAPLDLNRVYFSLRKVLAISRNSSFCCSQRDFSVQARIC